MPQHIGATRFGITQRDVAHQIDQPAQAGGIEILPCEHLGQHAFERGIFLFDGIHCLIHNSTDGGQFGFGNKVRPARFCWHKENVLRFVFVFVLGIGSGILTLACLQSGKHFFEGIGDVFQEDQPHHHMLVFGCVNVFAQLVGGFPKLLFQGFVFVFFCGFSHGCFVIFDRATGYCRL